MIRRRHLIEENDVDLSEYGIKELRDGLTFEELEKRFSWILEADIEDAVIGLGRNDMIIWYDGIWKNGTWEYGFWYGGTWKDGTWEDGIWKDGIWKSGEWLGGHDYDDNYHREGDSPDRW